MLSKLYVNELLKHIAGIDGMSMPTYLYLGLSATEPDSTTGAVSGEPSAPSYHRILVGGSKTDDTCKCFGNPEGGKVWNKQEVHFDAAQESFGLMKYFFLSSLESSGGAANMWGKINGDKGVDIEVTRDPVVPVFYVGELMLSIDASEET